MVVSLELLLLWVCRDVSGVGFEVSVVTKAHRQDEKLAPEWE